MTGASPGITMVHFTPTLPQAAARPWPKFPDEKAITPLALAFRVSMFMDQIAGSITAQITAQIPVQEETVG